MRTEQKLLLSKQIVAAISKAEYYRSTINKLKRYPNTFYESTVQLRLLGNRNTIWFDIDINESIKLLKSKLKKAEIDLNTLTKRMK